LAIPKYDAEWLRLVLCFMSSQNPKVYTVIMLVIIGIPWTHLSFIQDVFMSRQ